MKRRNTQTMMKGAEMVLAWLTLALLGSCLLALAAEIWMGG